MYPAKPVLGPSSLPDRQFVQRLFDWLAPNYDRAVVAYSLAQDLRWKSELVRRLRPRRGEIALDLATGTGLIRERVMRHLGPDGVVGLDINRRMLSRSAGEGRTHRCVVGDAVRLPFRDASFDVVTAGYLFKYVPLDRLSREIRRVLRPGGRFGGYDFSAPIRSSALGWTYDLYLRQVLTRLSRYRSPVDPGWAELFRFLADIAPGSGWESRADVAFLDSGFDRTLRIPSLGGAITWFWATTPGGRGAGLG